MNCKSCDFHKKQQERLIEQLKEAKEEAESFCRAAALWSGFVWGQAASGNEWAQRLINMKVSPEIQYNITYSPETK